MLKKLFAGRKKKKKKKKKKLGNEEALELHLDWLAG